MLHESRRCGRSLGLALASVRLWSALGGRGKAGGEGRLERREEARRPGKTAPLKATNLVSNVLIFLLCPMQTEPHCVTDPG